MIGGLIVDIEANCERLARLGVPYECDKPGKADITVNVSDETLKKLEKTHKGLTPDELCYMATGTLFHRKLTNFNGLMLHSSAIVMDGKGYMFSAHSGTGKSTHTALWCKVFGDRVQIINDDKPIIRKIGEEYRVFGTPWSGKTDLNINTSAPLKGIVFLARGEKNTINPIDRKKENVATLFVEQTVKPKTADRTLKMLGVADDILKTVPVYRLYCNISEDAVHTAYNILKNI